VLVPEVFAAVRRGMVPAYIYNDPDIFELERERIFSRAWIFVGHESEIPQPGDYVVRRILEDSFILTRDEGGHVRAHFNMCLHRGMQVCRAEMGNTSHFRCPYHGVRRRGGVQTQRPTVIAGTEHRDLQRIDLPQSGSRRCAAGGFHR
jgi:phenylpropionate dioxygenase-like ring-hydroxylating dioxygenase large terminal subunit